MLLFYIGVVIFIVISLIELNPKRFQKASPYQKSDHLSGPLITLTSALVGLISIIDKIFSIFPIKTTLITPFIFIGILLLIFGFSIRYLAIKELGKNFNYAVAPIKELKTKGMYRHIRHPSYLGTIMYAIGTPLVFSSKLGFIATLFVIFSILYRIKIEEKFLEKTIGNKYLKYKETTYRLVPYLY